MLSLETEFPQPGSSAWLLPDADIPDPEPVRILQRCADGRRFIKRLNVFPREACTANLRVDLERLVATREEALPKGRRRVAFRKARR